MKTTKPNKPKKKPTQKSESLYEASILIWGKKYQATGVTASEAISKLKPTNCNGKSILTIKHGEVVKDRVLMPRVTFRLFTLAGLSHEIVLKQVSTLFDGI